MIPLFALLVTLVIYGLIFWLFFWALGALAVPEPFHTVIRVVLVLAAVVVILGLLTGSIGPIYALRV